MITINITKAKTIGHEIRRSARAEEFKPLDETIMKQIPGTNIESVEAERQLVRDKYASIQAQIDAAGTPEEIKVALNLGGV